MAIHIQGQMQPIRHAQLSKDRSQMSFDRFFRDVQLVRDFFITGPRADLLDDFLFTGREHIEGWIGRGKRPVPLLFSERHKCVQQMRNDLATDPDFPLLHHFDGLDQKHRIHVHAAVALGARLKHRRTLYFSGCRREQDDPRRGTNLLKLGEIGLAVDISNREIEQQDDRLQRGEFLLDHGSIDCLMENGNLLKRLHPLRAPRRHIAGYENFEDSRPMTRHHVFLEPF